MDADLPRLLRIKYGLPDDPTEGDIDAWARRTRYLILSGGQNAEDAGDAAARAAFKGFGTRFYRSEADTIQALLALAQTK